MTSRITTFMVLMIGAFATVAFGLDRFATAQSSDVDTVFIATGENFPDALAVGPVAAAARAPLLLVQKNAIPASTALELDRLEPSRIVVVGGSGVVSEKVLADLAIYAGSVERIAGSDRYATAASVAGSLAIRDAAVVGANLASEVELREGVPVELASVVFDVPSSGGTLLVAADASFLRALAIGAQGGWQTIFAGVDLDCSDLGSSIAFGAYADTTGSFLVNSSLQGSATISEGSHSLVLCAEAFHVDTSEVTTALLAHVSAVWAPANSGGVVASFRTGTGETHHQYRSVIDRLRALTIECNAC